MSLTRSSLRESLRATFWPLSIGLFLSMFVVGYRLLELPAAPAVVRASVQIVESGLILLFLVALLESIFVLGLYVPGSLVIVVVVSEASRRGSPELAVKATVVAALAFVVGNLLNYSLGRTGYYRLLARFGPKGALQRTAERLERHGNKLLFFSQALPNLSALFAIQAGIARVPIWQYCLPALTGCIASCTLWGVFVYLAPVSVEKLASDIRYVYVLLFVWALVNFLWAFLLPRTKNASS